jgi:3-oxoacyl-[acyl-carrier-protein] synthase II
MAWPSGPESAASTPSKDLPDLSRQRSPANFAVFRAGCIINMVAGNVSIRYGFKGPNISIVTACTTATHNIGEAARMIAYGDADVMVAGGAEYGTTPTAYGGFTAARALSTRNDEPERASRPWDAGSGRLSCSATGPVFWCWKNTSMRAARCAHLRRVDRLWRSADAYHMTSPPDGGEGAARCMANAIADAGVNPEQVELHQRPRHLDPGRRSGRMRCRTRSLFGDHAGRVMISSTKSMTGHLLGAAGGVEAIFTILALHDGRCATNHQSGFNPDPACRAWTWFRMRPASRSSSVALTNSFGFGGTNGSLLFRRLS